MNDSNGEWIELHNAGSNTVNLKGWQLADLGISSHSHTIDTDLIIQPGGYVVLSRQRDSIINGGVNSDYTYTGSLQLTNSSDEIELRWPNGQVVDRVSWGNPSDLRVTAGKSLERTGFSVGQWQTATTVWPGSAGDFGTPGSGFVSPVSTATATATATADDGQQTATPTVTATLTPSSTATATVTADDGQQTATPTVTATLTPSSTATATVTTDDGQQTATPTVTATQTPSSTATATATVTATATATTDSGTASVYISEFLADPSAVADADGEWIELYNAGPDGVNLKGWTLVDLDGDRHTITSDLFVAAGGYVVLARNASPADNGGVLVDYAYTGVTLANSTDEILLLRPNGDEEDRVIWGGTSSLRISRGSSLERTNFATQIWATADSAWPNSLGDFGTPGGAYVPPVPTATVTPTPTATTTVTATPTATTTDGGPQTATSTATATASQTPSSTPTPTPTISSEGSASVFISEFLADPSAVSDANGEWIELYNAGPDVVNLKGWKIADLDSDSHTIAVDLLIAAGQYVVVGRNGNLLENGGVSLQYVYSGVTLANSADEILLLRPDGTEEDRVVWGGDAAWRVTAGKSLERITFGPVPVWLTASAAWTGSSGDFGSPGSSFVPPVPTVTPTATATTDGGPQTATATVTATPTATTTDGGPQTATATPTATASSTPSLTPTPTPTISSEGSASVFISEFLADPSAVPDANGEWIELYNAGPDPVNLKGWTVADLDSDSHTIAVDLLIAAGQYVVVGRNGNLLENGGVSLQYVYSGVTLANSADEILLLRPDGTEEDRVVWGGDAPWRVASGKSLERITFGPVPVWLTASAAWTGSSGDFGSPGSGFVPPVATVTVTPTATATADGGPQTATATATASATPSSTPTPTTSTGGSGTASVFISEFLADPSAVSDANGEWIELYNAGPDGVNLKGWTLADLDSDHHTIASDLFVEVGAYVLLGRNGNLLENGGVSLQYVYSGVTLANSADEILLLRPDGSEEDRVVWGGDAAWRATPGKSLERITFGPVPVWLTASAVWPGSSGDFGSPGSSFVPPFATVTPTPTTTATVTATPTATTTDGGQQTTTATPTVTASATPSSTPTPTTSTGGSGTVSVFISEFLADPSAVSDANGEWIELYNAGPDPVNLKDWVLADLGRDRHVITADIVVAAGGYILLARKADPSVNGGVAVDYVYTGINQANDEDEILLLRPNGDEEDRAVWGGSSGLTPERGKSLERASFGPLAEWVVADSLWPGSAGDFGTPGQGFVPPVGTGTPTATATATATATTDGGPQTATVTATPTPTPSATSVVLPALWPPLTEPSPLRIDEVNFQGSDLEFVALVNVGDSPLDLTGWVVGDGAIPGGGEGLYALPEGQLLAPHTPFVIARNGAAFHTLWGRAPNAQFETSESAAPVLERRRELASGRLALNDSGDELLLLDPALALADGVVWGNGDGASLGLTGTLDPISERSLQRVPGYLFPSERDPRHRFLWAAPAPFASVVLPESAVVPSPPLADGLQAVWGSLAAASNFTPGGAAPPHYVQAAGESIGLGIVAVADPLESPGQRAADDGLTAWRWTGNDGDAIVYGPPFATDGTTDSFLSGLASSGGLAQWTASGVPSAPAETVVALAADGLAVPGGLPAFSRRWQMGPMLPAGNAQPPVAGEAEPNPRYTGLAVADTSQPGLRDALAARRGWLTNRPGLALTLRAQTVGGVVWMGSAIEPQDALAVEVNYHDWNGHVAGLALWLNDRPIAQTDLPQGNGIWQATVSAAPGSVLYAVATQADGDFAVTAPLLVGNGDSAAVVINEVLPAPAADWNGDGTIDSNDEFIELYNPGDAPVSLAGWRLEDRSNSASVRRRFVLGVEHLVPAGGFLTVWGRDSHIGLNDDGDRVELYDSSDRLVDAMEWNSRTERGKSLSRVPDGGNWQSRAPTPDRSNPDDAPGPGGSGEPSESLPAWGSGAAPGTPGGEAVGPFRSVTAAKLAGMEDGVHFVGVVTVPPGLFNSVIYVADPALPPNEATAWLGVQVYLRRGTFPDLAEGDRVEIRGTMHSFRGEREILVERPEDIWRMGPGERLQPLAIDAADVGEALEGRLVTFEGIVTGWSGVSFFLADPAQPEAEPVLVTVRSSLGWRRPYVNKGERWQVTGIVSQSAAAPPWNGGYRVIVRYPRDLIEK